MPNYIYTSENGEEYLVDAQTKKSLEKMRELIKELKSKNRIVMIENGIRSCRTKFNETIDIEYKSENKLND